MEWSHEQDDGELKQGKPRGELSMWERRRKARAACNVEHAALLGCLRNGVKSGCKSARKAFYRCFVKHDGVVEEDPDFASWRRYKADAKKPPGGVWEDGFEAPAM